MRIWNAIICGIGGQGIMLLKRILENAALSEKLQGGNMIPCPPIPQIMAFQIRILATSF